MAQQIKSLIHNHIINKTHFILNGGAGSGKTHSLKETILDVYSENANSNIACITYTNVAADEIRRRIPFKNLFVSTIHEFLWNELKEYQKNLVDELISATKKNGNTVKYSGEPLEKESLDKVTYKHYRDIENGIISHDDLISISYLMFKQYPLLSKIIIDKYDYIFIDEYQDTKKDVIDILMEYIAPYAKKKLGIGFFGDEMQSIYEDDQDYVSKYIEKGLLNEIRKYDNYRCSINVINLLNKLRTDIKQKPSSLDNEGNINNKSGSALFLYSDEDFDLNKFKNKPVVKNWDFADIKDTRILYLTHRLIANEMGFKDLLIGYKNNDALIGNEPDVLAKHLLLIGEILYNFKNKNYKVVIDRIDKKIESSKDKSLVSACLKDILSSSFLTIGELIAELNKFDIVTKNTELIKYIANNHDRYSRIEKIDCNEVISLFKYKNNHSVFSTQHGIKGAEFENVILIMDNGRWNRFNFENLFLKNGKETVLKRTEKLFYVACSRAKNNLIVYYKSPSIEVIEEAKNLFDSVNVIKIY